jgi:NADH dehydrogenase FAD-containing subunit
MLPVVVIIGAGYGGIQTAVALRGSAHVVVVEKKDFLDHCVAGLRGYAAQASAAFYAPPVMRLDASSLRFAVVLRDTVVNVSADCVVTLASGASVRADFVVVATGAKHKIRVSALSANEATKEYADTRERLATCKHALVVGGGPVGIEIAGEMAHYLQHLNITLASRSDQLMGDTPFADALSGKLTKALKTVGGERVTVKTGLAVDRDVAGGASWTESAFTFLDTPTTVAGIDTPVDVIVNGCMAHIDTSFVAVGERDARGALCVNEHFQLAGGHDRIFVVGDAAALRVRMAYVAGLQGDAAARNILQVHADRPPTHKVDSQTMPAAVVPVGPTHGAMAIHAPTSWMSHITMGAFMTGVAKGKTLFSDRYLALLRTKATRYFFFDRSSQSHADAKAALFDRTTGDLPPILNE